MRKALANQYHCASEFTLAVLGGKWKTVILSFLKERPCRYGELRKLVPALSDKVLSQRLSDLVDAGLVARVKASRAAKAELYTLTPRGKSLGAPLQALYAWGRSNAAAFGVKIREPLKELKNDRA